MSDSIWGAPAERVVPAPIDTTNITSVYNNYLNGTPTSADSNTTRLLPCTSIYTPLSETHTLNAEEMRSLEKAANDSAMRAKFREVLERGMSEAAARVAHPHLYIDAPPPTKVWPWGGVAGSDAVKQLQIKILASLAGGNRTGTAQQTTSTTQTPAVTGAAIAREAAAATPVDEMTSMDTTPSATKTAPRPSAYPHYPQPSHVQRGPIAPLRPDMAFVNTLADQIEEAYPGFDGVNNVSDVAAGMREVAALLYRDSYMMGGSKIRGQMIINASPEAERVNNHLKQLFDHQHFNVGQQVTARALDMEALAAMLEERADLKAPKGEKAAPLPAALAAPVPNMTAIEQVVEGLVDVFPNLVANLSDMISGMREVAAMLQRDVDNYGRAPDASASPPTPSAAAETVHSILLSTFQDQQVPDAQKVTDIAALAKSLVEKANAFN